MKTEKLERGVAFFCLSVMALAWLALFGEFYKLQADTGHEGATRIERGSYNNVRLVSGSSVAGTEFFGASTKRPDGICRNNTGSTVWIGTVSAAQYATVHSNIGNGFPVLSTETFKLDGSNTGAWYFTCEIGIAACEFRCLDGLVR